MLKNTLVAGATAIAIAFGTLASAGTASATYYGGHYITKVFYVPKKICEPVFKKVVWYDAYGYAHYKTKKTFKCYTVQKKVVKKIWVPAKYAY